MKKDPGIPNLWPLKEEFLQKIELQKVSVFLHLYRDDFIPIFFISHIFQAKIEEEKERQKDSRYKEQQKRRSLEFIAKEAANREKVNSLSHCVFSYIL